MIKKKFKPVIKSGGKHIFAQTFNTPKGTLRGFPKKKTTPVSTTPPPISVNNSVTGISFNGGTGISGSATTSAFTVTGGTSYVVQNGEWLSYGMLEGFNEKEQEVLSKFLDQANQLIQPSNKSTNDEYQMVLPIIRRAYGEIVLNKNTQYEGWGYTPSTEDEIKEIIKKFYVKEIINSYRDLSNELLPIMKKSLSYLDSEAEFCRLVAEQYSTKLIEEYKRATKNRSTQYCLNMFKVSNAYFVDMDESGFELGHIEFIHMNTDEVIEFDVGISDDVNTCDFFDNESVEIGKKYGVKIDDDAIKYICDKYESNCDEKV